ncbi:hypothetical protein P3342_009514 [Pyrenophora teres f. teres]|nr:hypothetical protein P3342_009514 [Pyrenophora teres f. teres]
MRFAFALAVFGIGADALVIRHTSQCFQLESSGGPSGILGQLGDGQNRVGGNGLPTGCYCLDSDGGFTDSNGRGCILTPPTTQFQCDVGATPTDGFAVGPDGAITYNGDDTFYACPVNDQGEYNVYTKPAPGQEKCVEISLGSAGSCGSGNGPTPSATSPPAETETKPTPPPEVPASELPPYPTGLGPTQPEKPEETATPRSLSNRQHRTNRQHRSNLLLLNILLLPNSIQRLNTLQRLNNLLLLNILRRLNTLQHPNTLRHQSSRRLQSNLLRPDETPSGPAESPSAPVKPPTAPIETPPAPVESHPAPIESHPAPVESHPAAVESHPVPVESHPAPVEAPSGPEEMPPAPSHTSPPSPPPHPSCPEDLNGPYEYPHLIIPVSSSSSSEPSGSSYNGQVSPTTCTLFNFDIPASMAGKSCSTIFMLPLKSELETSDYTLSGSGVCTITRLDGPATEQSTWDDKPEAEAQVASVQMTPGHSWTVDSGPCEEGPLSYEVCSGGDFELSWFQDYNPSPIGLFVREC